MILYDWPTIKGKFQKFKEIEQFVNMVSKFGVGKSTIVFKIALFKLINNYLKIKNSFLSLHYFKKYFKTIREIVKKTLVNLSNRNLFKLPSVSFKWLHF